jgi:hypothetical protein
MWRRTYERLRRRAFDLEVDAEQEFDSRCAQLNQQSEKKTKGRFHVHGVTTKSDGH